MKTIEYENGRYKVRYCRSIHFCCDKCCFGRCEECPDCSPFHHPTKERYAYFRPVKQRRTWADVAVAMVALAIIALIGILCSCERRSPESEAQQTTQEIDRHIKKATIDGHDYLLFFGKVSVPPTVIHSESCPCKSENEQNHE